MAGTLGQGPGELRGATVLALVLALAASRSYDLAGLPAFIDESIHLQWAFRLREEGVYFRPFRDGKPLQAFVLAVTTWGSAYPLLAARLTSAAVGAVCLWASLRLGRALFDSSTAVVAGALYVACPFALFYDRMALADVYLSALAALTLLASVTAARRPGPARAVGAGLALGGCVLAKVLGALVAPVPALATALLALRRGAAWRGLALTYVVAAALATGPLAYFVASSAQMGKLAGQEGAVDVEALLSDNLGDMASVLWTYWTGPVVLLAALALGLALVHRRAPEVLLAAAALLPVAVVVATSEAWYPRYVLLATVPALVLAARGLTLVAETASRLTHLGSGGARALLAALALAAAVPSLRLDAAILADPAAAPLPRVERFQYVEGFSSGYGADQASRLLEAELARSPAGLLVVADDAGRRTMALALLARFHPDPRVEVVTAPLDTGETRALLLSGLGRRPAFVVTGSKEGASGRLLAAGLRCERLAVLRKPSGRPAGELFRVLGRQP